MILLLHYISNISRLRVNPISLSYPLSLETTWLRLRHHTSLLAAVTSPEETSVDTISPSKSVCLSIAWVLEMFYLFRETVCKSAMVTLVWKNSDFLKRFN